MIPFLVNRYLQNFVVISWLEFGWMHQEISTKFELLNYDGNKYFSEMVTQTTALEILDHHDDKTIWQLFPQYGPSVPQTLKCKHHFDRIFIIGCTGSCHFWQLVHPVTKILSKWQHFCVNEVKAQIQHKDVALPVHEIPLWRRIRRCQ